MQFENGCAKNVKITYIGGGSRGWAWKLMSDLAACTDMSGSVYLYDINMEAAEHNAIIGNLYNTCEGARSHWDYYAAKTPAEALTGADFVVISILPGTFDEMESDVHTPEKYGIYQAVGDTTGPGGIVRAMRTIPMYEEIAEYIKAYCPNAWVINYTNPMTICVRTLYRVFPEIKAFGCCHEVFDSQRCLRTALKDICNIDIEKYQDIRVNPVAVNHFTWITKATYQDMDLFPVYRKFVEKYWETGYTVGYPENWRDNMFSNARRVMLDLFRRYGYIAAAGDRHLAEFCPGNWYLQSPARAREWGFGLTPVSWRKSDLQYREAMSERLRNGEEKVKLSFTGEEGVHQMRAILGLCEPLVTNVNMPNRGQIPNLPMGAVVETNAVFCAGMVTPVQAGEVPAEIYPMVARICGQQEATSKAIAQRDLQKILDVFVCDPLVTCSYDDAKALFKEMVLNTKAYLTSYDLSTL